MRSGVIKFDGFAQRHVRRDAKRRELGDDVHLAEEARVARELREHLVLVVKRPPASMQRRLVERREADAVESARQRQVDHAI